MKENIQELLTQKLKDALSDLSISQEIIQSVVFEFSLSSGFGDLSCNAALRLAGHLKQPPMKIAARIAEAVKPRIADSSLARYLGEVKAEGAGFLNFYLNNAYFYAQLSDILTQKQGFGKQDIGAEVRTVIEFVSANPTGPLSVAHARQAAVGDALANILLFLGFRVQKEYYLNDEGNQINILGNSIELRMKELSGEKVEFPENYYQGDYIYDIAKKAASHKSQATSIAEFGVRDILSTIEEELKDFRVTFDSWYSQKTLRETGKIEQSLAYLKEKGYIYEEDGAVWFKSTRFGDDKDRVVIKSDGSYTYLAPDIAYHRDKYARGFSWVINLWGPDHHGYINRLKAAIQALGHPSDSLAVVIVQLASIFRDGKAVEMSTRRGHYITLREVLDEVGPDASRFFFLMRRTSSHLNFDLEIAKKQTAENPVYYVQYAYARISSILRNSTPATDTHSIDFTLLKEPQEIALIKKLWQFTYILYVCYKTLDPYMMTVYLQEVAEAFHRFYDAHRVLGQDTALTTARLSLIQATKIILATGFDLLGISKPEQM